MSSPNLETGIIVNTTVDCRLKGGSWPDIPTLLWPDGIDQDASDWFRVLVVDFGISSSSANEYAQILRPFLRFCRQRKRKWQSVDDEFLVIWREHLRRAKKVSIARINTSLVIIFSFYHWAEESKRIRFCVGVYTQSELPQSMGSIVFAISAMQKNTKGRRGKVDRKWTTPLTLNNPRQKVTNRHTPSEKETQDIHSVAIERQHGVRDSLMFSWAEETGLRRAELLRLCKSHLPNDTELANIIENDLPWLVSIQRKGGSSKPVNVLSDLIIHTLDYIDIERRTIVDQFLQSTVGYSEPDELFLSSKTGLVLHPDSVTAIGRLTFKAAGVSNANIHRLRASHAVRTVEALLDAVFEGETIVPESSWVETILVKAAEMMGHRSTQSLRPYLTYVLNRRIQTADSTKSEKIKSRLRQLERSEILLFNRYSESIELTRAARLIEKNRKNEAVVILKKLIEKLD